MTEETYFSDGSVTIAGNRADIWGKTYIIGHVTSVQVITKTPNRTLPIILFLVGIISGLVAFADRESALTCGGLGVVLLLLGAAIYKTQATRHVLRIALASGEADALASRDAGYVRRVADALNRAIAEQG